MRPGRLHRRSQRHVLTEKSYSLIKEATPGCTSPQRDQKGAQAPAPTQTRPWSSQEQANQTIGYKKTNI